MNAGIGTIVEIFDFRAARVTFGAGHGLGQEVWSAIQFLEGLP